MSLEKVRRKERTMWPPLKSFPQENRSPLKCPGYVRIETLDPFHSKPREKSLRLLKDSSLYLRNSLYFDRQGHLCLTLQDSVDHFSTRQGSSVQEPAEEPNPTETVEPAPKHPRVQEPSSGSDQVRAPGTPYLALAA